MTAVLAWSGAVECAGSQWDLWDEWDPCDERESHWSCKCHTSHLLCPICAAQHCRKGKPSLALRALVSIWEQRQTKLQAPLFRGKYFRKLSSRTTLDKQRTSGTMARLVLVCEVHHVRCTVAGRIIAHNNRSAFERNSTLCAAEPAKHRCFGAQANLPCSTAHRQLVRIATNHSQQPFPKFGGRRLNGSTVGDLGRGREVPPNFSLDSSRLWPRR